MSNKMNLISSAILLSISSTVFAGAMGDASARASVDMSKRYYIGIVGGASYGWALGFAPEYNRGGGRRGIRAPENTDWNGDFNAGGVWGGFLGYQVNPNVALQLEFRSHGNFEWRVNGNNIAGSSDFPTINDLMNDISSQTFMLNMILSPSSCCETGLKPYVQAGIGFARNNLGVLEETVLAADEVTLGLTSNLNGAKSTNFAWNAGLGVDYGFSPAVSMRLGYTFSDTGKISTGGSGSAVDSAGQVSTFDNLLPFTSKHLVLHDITVGLSYKFDRPRK